MRPLLILALPVYSVMTFGFGMLGPLTPSEGSPSIWAYAHYAGMPIVLIVLGVILAISNRRAVWRTTQGAVGILGLSGGITLLVFLVRTLLEASATQTRFFGDPGHLFLFLGAVLIQLLESAPAFGWLAGSNRYLKRLPRANST